MKVRRVVSVYDINSDKLIREISINNIPLIELRNILNVFIDDLDVYKVYPISKDQFSMFTKFLPEMNDVNKDNVEFYVECFQD